MTNEASVQSIRADICALADYEQHAKRRLPQDVWAYINGGATDEHTITRNRQKFDEILLRSRVLQDVKGGHCKQTLLNETLEAPLMIAPLAYQKLAHPMGEIATIKAAEAQGIGFCLSTLASSTIEDVASHAPNASKWFQLYCQPSFEDTKTLIKRAEQAGYRAIIITVDAPINGVRNQEQRSQFTLPASISAVNLQGKIAKAQPGNSVFEQWMSMAPTWQTIQKIRQTTQLPILLKGIMHPLDAKQAIALGANGIIVSNHGGRVLDTQPSSIEVIASIRKAIGKEPSILLDSGIRRGSDIFKAIALGADAVLLGRPVFHALAVAGPMGVAHAIRILRDELEATMALCGCKTIADISKDCLY